MNNTIFVYGTLRKDECNSHFLHQSIFLGFDYLEGFVMVDLGEYPMAVETGFNEDIILIEIYKITDNTLMILDEFEDYQESNTDSLYNRKTVVSVSGKTGFIYCSKNPEIHLLYNKLLSGDWKKRFN